MSQVIKGGTVTVHPDGSVHVDDDFEIEFLDGPPDYSGCQQYFNVGATWAIQQIAHALTTEGFYKGSIT